MYSVIGSAKRQMENEIKTIIQLHINIGKHQNTNLIPDSHTFYCSFAQHGKADILFNFLMGF